MATWPPSPVLASYYATVAEAMAAIDGEVSKVMGDGMLVFFPVERPSRRLPHCVWPWRWRVVETR